MTRSATVLMTVDTVGGVWSYALGLCAALPELRFILATLGPGPRPPQRAAASLMGNVVLEEGDFRLEWMAGGCADIAPSRRWLEALVRRHEVDLVQVNGYAQVRLDCDCPVVSVAHSDVLSWFAAVRGCSAPGEWDNYRRQVIAGLGDADCVVAPSRAALDDLRRRYRLPLADARVIPNGIALGAFAPLPKRPVIMAAGRVWDDAKNLRLLDEIAPFLDWPVEIAGETTHPEKIVTELLNARALGVLGQEEMRRRLGETAIFAAPALYEPFGLGILEAASAGCVLVLGDIASLRENWDGAAMFLPAADAGGWRAALARLIGDEGERAHLAAAARRRAERFTISATAGRYRSLYHELIRRAAGTRAA